MTEIKENVILKPYTTFKAGGPAKYYAEPASVEEIKELIDYAKANNIKYFVLGAGSNILISDNGFDGLVIRLARNFASVSYEDKGDYGEITASSGAMLALLGNKCTEMGLVGAEFACGIPGSVGGAVYMNAGAYGPEIKDIAKEVTFLLDGDIRTITAEECEFGYRDSIFQKAYKDAVILGLTIRLPKGNKEEISSKVAELKAKRCASQPVEIPSAGSTFKRPVGHFAGGLIQDSGLKGFALDESGAQVSPKHAGFVVNNGGTANAEDIMRLISYVSDKVYEDSGVRLEMEVKKIGEWN